MDVTQTGSTMYWYNQTVSQDSNMAFYEMVGDEADEDEDDLDYDERVSHKTFLSALCLLITITVAFNPFKSIFNIVIFIHYKPRIAGAILHL